MQDSQEDQLGEITQLSTINDVTRASWRPVEGETQLMGWNEDEVSVYDVTEEMRVAASCGGMLKGRRGKENVGKGRWNPHHGSKQFSLCVGNQVFMWLK